MQREVQNEISCKLISLLLSNNFDLIIRVNHLIFINPNTNEEMYVIPPHN